MYSFMTVILIVSIKFEESFTQEKEMMLIPNDYSLKLSEKGMLYKDKVIIHLSISITTLLIKKKGIK